MTANVQKRDSGIDLLRLAAMGLIVLHHLLIHGGIAFAFPAFSASGMVMHFFNAVTRCAVNTYALISGYVMVQSRFRPSRWMGLWLQVVFYGLLAALCLPLMGGTFRPFQLFRAVTPVSHDQYWYFTCYTVVFFLSPFLNLLLKQLSGRQTALLTAGLTGLFSVLPALMLTDRFQLNGGYHPVWLAVLYLIGGAMKLHGEALLKKRKTAAAVFVVCVMLGWGFRLLVLKAGMDWLEELLLNYTAPTMLACSAALLVLFAGRILPGWLAKAASVLSPLTFGVYLIHDNPLVREYLIKMKLTGLAGLSPAGMLAGLFACWAGVYALCLALEWGRAKLFDLLKVPSLCVRAENRLFQWAQRRFPGADA